MLRKSGQTLAFSVWSEGFQHPVMRKKTEAVLTELWLRPVGVHRMHPVVILEDLVLSRIDRTLGGSVRSLPPERPVSGSRAASGLFLRFLFYRVWGPHLTTTIAFFLT